MERHRPRSEPHLGHAEPQFPYQENEGNKSIDLAGLFYGPNEKMCTKGLTHSGTQQGLQTWRLLNNPWYLKGLHAKAKRLGDLNELFGFIREGGVYSFKGFTKTGLA